MKVIVAVLLLCLCGCGGKSGLKPEEMKEPVKRTKYLKTVEHDGHKWIMSYGHQSTPVHHPDCPCGKGQ